MKSSTDRSEVQSRAGANAPTATATANTSATAVGGKRKKQKVFDTPVKFFDIRSPLISPSNQSYFAKQTVPNYISTPE